MTVRQEMLEEAKAHAKHYQTMFSSGYDQMLKVLEVTSGATVGADKWQFAPDMMVLAANTYKCLCLMISSESPSTYVTSRLGPPACGTNPPIVMAFVNGNHFIQATITPTNMEAMPFPPVFQAYTSNTKRIFSAWRTRLGTALERWPGHTYVGSKDPTIVMEID